MLGAAHPQINSRATFTRAAICFLLVLLSLYNPFLTVSDACNVLHVHHPLSFRATVASSELRRCTVDDSRPFIAAPQALETTDPTPVETQTPPEFPARQDQHVVGPLQVTLGGFWFRPPPSI